MAVCIRDVMLTQLSMVLSSSNVSCRVGHAVQSGIMTMTDRSRPCPSVTHRHHTIVYRVDIANGARAHAGIEVSGELVEFEWLTGAAQIFTALIKA